jgi:hypothetical protein
MLIVKAKQECRSRETGHLKLEAMDTKLASSLLSKHCRIQSSAHAKRDGDEGEDLQLPRLGLI